MTNDTASQVESYGLRSRQSPGVRFQAIANITGRVVAERDIESHRSDESCLV
jgi:hypothetical protein